MMFLSGHVFQITISDTFWDVKSVTFWPFVILRTCWGEIDTFWGIGQVCGMDTFESVTQYHGFYFNLNSNEESIIKVS